MTVDSIKGITDRVLLAILDGLGLSDEVYGNAFHQANTPTLDHLFMHYPFAKLNACGEAVGLPDGIVGNSEVGHMTMGSGRMVLQSLVRINQAIADKSFFTKEALVKLAKTAHANTQRIHLMVLLSDAGVHGHIDHLLATIKALTEFNLGLNIYIHAFMDGRDTAKDAGIKYACNLQEFLKGHKHCHFASMQGRSISMDRDQRWDKIESAYQMLTGQGTIKKISPVEYLRGQYAAEIFDEFIFPVLFCDSYAIGKDDAVFSLNFRPDRIIQLTKAFAEPKFDHFSRHWIIKNYLCMTPYISENCELPILFDTEKIQGGLSETLSNKGMKQFKIAETEKYAHVTFFFNGGYKTPFKGEEWVLIPSPQDVKTYDQKPEMSAQEVTNKLVDALSGQYYFYLVNYANSDMVGHTGNFAAAKEAIEFVDKCLARLVTICKQKNIALIVSSDHGNSDKMLYPDGRPYTSHSFAPVPFCLVHPTVKDTKILPANASHTLADVAPTILHTLGINTPSSFTGKSIFA